METCPGELLGVHISVADPMSLPELNEFFRAIRRGATIWAARSFVPTPSKILQLRELHGL
jgi:hypothetical protein